MQLASNLIAVLSQALCPRIDTDGMVAAYEFMYVTPGIQNLIRENKSFRIDSEIQTGKSSACSCWTTTSGCTSRPARSAPKRRSTRARTPACMVDRMQTRGHRCVQTKDDALLAEAEDAARRRRAGSAAASRRRRQQPKPSARPQIAANRARMQAMSGKK